jgi:uncharacterized repeat protein (TIGR01451 family)
MKVVSVLGVLVLLLISVGSVSAYSPALKIEKTASSSTYNTAGQIITYTYKVTNSGNVKISGPITVTDNKIGTFVISNNDIKSGAKISGKATYKITDRDLYNGSVNNLAYATGKYNKKKILSNTASCTIKTNQISTFTIQKYASPTTFDHAGQTITYTYKVTNSDKLKISGPITIIDNKIGTFTISKKDLAPGAIINVKVNYKITSQDLKAGSITNLAYATATYNKQKIKSNTASFTISSSQELSMTLEKSASQATYSYVGENITYTYKVINSGNYKISGPIAVTDNKIGTFTISTKDLAPGAIVVGKPTYKITDTDLKAGSVTNLAIATASVTNQVNTASSVSSGFSSVGCNIKVVSNEAQVTITTGQHNIPEFPSIVLPIAAIVGLIIISGRKR